MLYLINCNMRFLNFAVLFIGILTFSACKKNQKAAKYDAELINQNENTLTKVIIYDGFTPPVASRIYSYTALAAYEAMRYADPKQNSLIIQLKGFSNPPVPQKGKDYNYALAATKAFFNVANKVTFSVDTLKKYENSIFNSFKDQLDDSTYARSMAFGELVAKVVLKRATGDNYLKSRGKPRYLGNNGKAQWRPTPPDYLDGVEFCWGDMKPFGVLSSAQFRLPPPPTYSAEKNSIFFKQADEVYQSNKNLSDEQEKIARFWDDNPFAIQHAGHAMFANKKITPGGHWMGITTIACRKANFDAVKTAQAYALTAITLYDSFICSWETKYKYNYERPVSIINESIDHNWLPLLQTPPFPEYPAGHASISGATATVLTHVFGENFAFEDTTEVRYIGLKRHFNSFLEAADETALSRFYGGIHFKNSTITGSEQGKKIGEFIWTKLKLTK